MAVLVILALLGGWFTYTTHVASGTHIENQTVAEWESTGAFEHSATVMNGSGAFENGTVLSNQSTYFTAVSPVLDGTFTYFYNASDGSLTVNTTVQFVLHSVGESDGNTTEYWRITRQLGKEQVASLAPGETVRVSFSRNISAMKQLATQIEEQIGGSPGTVEALVVARVHTEGRIEDKQMTHTRRYTMPIEIEEGRYRVVDSGPVSNTTTVTRQVSVPNNHKPIQATGSVLLLLLPLGLLVGLVGARSQGLLDIDEDERDRLETGRAHEEFDEWITTGRFPDAVLDNPQIEVSSLEGLVDVAIDTNSRVIADPDRNGYFVFGDGVCYTYSSSAPNSGFEYEKPDQATGAESEAESDESVEQATDGEN